MASSSGNSSGSTQNMNSGSEEDLQVLMDQRKRKRMQSNRESARRSRMRKQRHLDDLTAQVARLRNENNQILTTINITTQHYLTVEAENSVLRAQKAELSNRLDSLNEILNYMNTNNGIYETTTEYHHHHHQDLHLHEQASVVDSFLNPWNSVFLNQPIMASATDVFQY
ncbi:Basic-leucine zipper domain [Dillenia turbinata]|uniref:Basic-leucine zipper domain n=1 Tax=Dillenia turbinata TaxID=194707 RepID=A0AAN8VPM2_9MAGN